MREGQEKNRSHGEGVWPPPVYVENSALWSNPFRAITDKKAEGVVSRFRFGQVLLTEEGMVIAGGQVAKRSLIETDAFQYQELFIPWSDIIRIGSVPRRNIACLVFPVPDEADAQSLAFKMDSAAIDTLRETSYTYIPDKVGTVELTISRSVGEWIFRGLVVVLTSFFVLLAVFIIALGINALR